MVELLEGDGLGLWLSLKLSGVVLLDAMVSDGRRCEEHREWEKGVTFRERGILVVYGSRAERCDVVGESECERGGGIADG